MAASHTEFTGSNLTDSIFIFTCIICILVFYIHTGTFYTVLITGQYIDATFSSNLVMFRLTQMWFPAFSDFLAGNQLNEL